MRKHVIDYDYYANQYALNIISGVPGYTLIKALEIFKDKFYLVKKYYRIYSMFPKLSKQLQQGLSILTPERVQHLKNIHETGMIIVNFIDDMLSSMGSNAFINNTLDVAKTRFIVIGKQYQKGMIVALTKVKNILDNYKQLSAERLTVYYIEQEIENFLCYNVYFQREYNKYLAELARAYNIYDKIYNEIVPKGE